MNRTITRRDFIMGPFTNCPECKRTECFGVLRVGGHRYCKECRECGAQREYYLPPLDRKVIYLDQNAISDMMKTLNPKSKGHRKADKSWRDLYARLDVLCKKMLITCPDSIYHTQESQALGESSRAAAQRMYEQLSRGLSFEGARTIQEMQIHQMAKAWADGAGYSEIPLGTGYALMGGSLGKWPDRLNITVSSQYGPEMLDGLERSRHRTAEMIQGLFQRWAQESGRKFWDWFEEEVGAVLSDLKGPSRWEYRYALRGVDGGEFTSEIEQRIDEFLASEHMRRVPSIRIGCLLYAALARKASTGMQPPGAGIATDIAAVSSLLPYCDAIFVDRQMRSLLMDAPVREEIEPYGTQVFSSRTRDEFLTYLDRIEETGDQVVVDMAAQAYGPPKPYTQMFGLKD